MQISELRKALSSLEAALGHLQASKGAISDLERLNTCLAQFDELSVTQFCKACEQLKPNASAANKDIDGALVAAYFERFTMNIDDRTKFTEVMADLKADKNVRIGELNAIAQKFVGGTSKYAKKPDAYKDIHLRLEAHLRAGARLDAASDIF